MSPSGGDVEYANLANQNGLPGVATMRVGWGSDPSTRHTTSQSRQAEDSQSLDTVVHQYLTQDAVNTYQPAGDCRSRPTRTTPTQGDAVRQA